MLQLMTEKEIVAHLKLSRATIQRLRQKGLPTVKIGKSVRFDPAEVEEWVRQNRDGSLPASKQ